MFATYMRSLNINAYPFLHWPTCTRTNQWGFNPS